MPTYEYKCDGCGVVLESRNRASVQKWACDETPDCKGYFHRLYSVGGILFKGSGFYKTGG